jgi:hypothetical protein
LVRKLATDEEQLANLAREYGDGSFSRAKFSRRVSATPPASTPLGGRVPGSAGSPRSMAGCRRREHG